MFTYIKKSFQGKNGHLPSIFPFALIIFFWALFDGILGYAVPLLMEARGLSIGTIGLIIGTSSISGAIFDFLICKVLKNSDFRRIFLIMFSICLFYPLVLSYASTIWVFLIAMSLWGIYFDLYGFGVFNFISHYSKKEDYVANFGILQTFVSLAGVLAPLIAGIIIATGVNWHLFVFSWFFLGISLFLFLVLISVIRKHKKGDLKTYSTQRKRGFFTEIHLWKKIGNTMLPVLCITFFLSFMNAFFWTLAPLYVESENMGVFGGLFLTAYILPALFSGWFISRITKVFGKKRTAFLGVLIGSSLLSSFFYLEGPIAQIIIVFIAACFTSIAMPSISAACSDYISETPQVDEEIAGIEDFSGNSGYIVGPVFAGFIAQILGIPAAFSILGLIGTATAIVLLLTTPRNINIRVGRKEL